MVGCILRMHLIFPKKGKKSVRKGRELVISGCKRPKKANGRVKF